MVLYTCENCNKEYTDKSDYVRHCNRKIKCKKSLRFPSKVSPVVEYKCENCEKTFTRKDNLERHRDSRCKVTKETNKIDILEKKIDALTDIIKELKEESISTITNNNHNETNQNKTILNNS